MYYREAVFKIGGQILEDSNHIKSTISQLTQLLKEKILRKIIIIPGGGSFANFVRKIDKELELGADLAHWMAIYSMNCNGQILTKNYPDLEIIEDLKTFQDSDQIFCVLLPYNLLHKDDILPHNWDVTSDSIALHVANKLKLKECFLIKNISGIINFDKKLIKYLSTYKYNELKDNNKLDNINLKRNDLKKSAPIDSHLLKLIEKYKTPCYILDGRLYNQRIIEFFNTDIPDEKKIYTKITN